MEAINFAEEFTRLILSYTKSPSLNDTQTQTPLTKEEVVNAVRNVLCTVLAEQRTNGENLPVDLPSEGIAVTFPLISITPKDENKQPNNSGDVTPDNRLLTPNVNISNMNKLSYDDDKENVSPSAESQDSKKLIPKSSPEICVNGVHRSDTFIREEYEKAAQNASTSSNLKALILQSIDVTQKYALKIVNEMDIVKKQLSPGLMITRPLSSNNNSFAVASTTAKVLPNTRRSLSSITPLNGKHKALRTKKDDSADRRKSAHGIAKVTLTPRKLNETTPINRSASSMGLSTYNKSPGSVAVPAKNPKYAHVQSTIPKAIVFKKKA